MSMSLLTPAQKNKLPYASATQGAHGRLGLNFRRMVDGGTQVDVTTQMPPLRMIRAFRTPDDAALIHLHNISGGVLGGDALEVEIDVGAGARAQVTTTGATRVYRHRPGRRDAVQRTHFRVAEGGLLEYLPDPLIPFAGSRYRQETSFHLAQGSTLFAWDVISPGREAHGEVFAYARLALQTHIETHHGPILLEEAELEPARQGLGTPPRLGRYRTMATLYVCQPGAKAETWHALEAELATLAAALTCPRETLWGASPLVADGFIVRGLARQGRHLVAGLPRFWQAAKRTLCQADALPPRKIY